MLDFISKLSLGQRRFALWDHAQCVDGAVGRPESEQSRPVTDCGGGRKFSQINAILPSLQLSVGFPKSSSLGSQGPLTDPSQPPTVAERAPTATDVGQGKIGGIQRGLGPFRGIDRAMLISERIGSATSSKGDIYLVTPR